MYNLDYYELMLRKNSRTAEQICKIRWNFVKDIKAKIVIDYGSGVGWFRAFRPKGVTVYSYDIGDYPQTDIPISIDKVDLFCMWDVLEHIPNFEIIDKYLTISKYVALSVPILPDKQDLSKWKHYKPIEHLHIFTEEVLINIFNGINYKLEKQGSPECPPRQDIKSFLFRNINL